MDTNYSEKLRKFRVSLRFRWFKTDHREGELPHQVFQKFLLQFAQEALHYLLLSSTHSFFYFNG